MMPIKISSLLGELKLTEGYDTFKKKYPEAYFCAGFFILDLLSKKDTKQLDFFVKSKERIFGFEYPFEQVREFEDEVKSIREQSVHNLKYDLSDIEAVAKKILSEKKSQLSPTKIIAILKEDVWNLTCMDNSLGIVRIKLDAKTGETLKFEKVSFFDMVKVDKKK